MSLFFVLLFLIAELLIALLRPHLTEFIQLQNGQMYVVCRQNLINITGLLMNLGWAAKVRGRIKETALSSTVLQWKWSSFSLFLYSFYSCE
jgi:hypothetical protein